MDANKKTLYYQNCIDNVIVKYYRKRIFVI